MSTDIGDQRQERRTTCCGKGGAWVPAEGAPLIPSCQLCPEAATYWDPTGEKKAALAVP